ncbi:MAG: acyl carrier protein [Dehalococcoidales bacterium]|nr:acyl carrier protein [Dehalococcoidales bacterium]
MTTIPERTKKVIMNKLGVNESSIVPTAIFTTDLGADSLDLVELIMAFEEEFSTPDKQIKIPDEDANKLKTVKDVNDYLAALNIA